jgi:hypothetical protein
MFLKKISLFGLLLIGFWVKSTAQIVYGSTLSQIYSTDLTACTTTLIVPCPLLNDMCISPSGLFYGLNGLNVISINPISGATAVIAPIPLTGGVASSLEWGNDGLLYAMNSKIWQINPTNGAVVDMGNLPSGWTSMGDLVILNGVCYGTILSASVGYLVIVNLISPGASTILSPLPTVGLVGGASVTNPTCPRLFWFRYGNNPQVHYFDINSQTWGIQCASFPASFGGGDSQNDYYFPISCGCTTNAGNVTNTISTICGIANPATVPFTGGETLESNDLLKYILFTDLNNPSNSILLQSSTPIISFNPSNMVVGQTYYLGTLAGNNLNGLVDLADPCKDFSNTFAQVTWRNLPSVTFSLANQNICEGDCKNINVTFTGVPPFNLSGVSLYGGNQVGTFNQVFSANSGVLTVCAPPNLIAGNLVIQSTNLTDAWCICQ